MFMVNRVSNYVIVVVVVVEVRFFVCYICRWWVLVMMEVKLIMLVIKMKVRKVFVVGFFEIDMKDVSFCRSGNY